MEKLREIVIKECVVWQCDNANHRLIVAVGNNADTGQNEIKKFPVCPKHFNGLYRTINRKFSPMEYTIASYQEL